MNRVQQILVPEMWAGLAIAVTWLAVLFTAIFGPDVVVTSPTGSTTLPCVVPVALFAWLATWLVAKHGFGRGHK